MDFYIALICKNDLKNKKQGFSLVELSIVLVIIGLITGGIVAGQNMIRSAQLRSLAVEADNIVTIVNLFNDKYNAIPGDMSNAVNYWGDNSTHCSNASFADSNPGTCNGNGDGVVREGAGGNQISEMYMFWNHLSYAGLLPGQFSGVAGSASMWNSVIGVNSPVSKITNGTFLIYTYSPSGNTFWLDGVYQNDLIFAKPEGCCTEAGILSPEEVWGIDKKLDDGHPGLGNLNAGSWQTCTTPISGADSSSNRNIRYDLDNTQKNCAFIIVDRF